MQTQEMESESVRTSVREHSGKAASRGSLLDSLAQSKRTHAGKTEELGSTAVDAWSPVRNE